MQNSSSKREAIYPYRQVEHRQERFFLAFPLGLFSAIYGWRSVLGGPKLVLICFALSIVVWWLAKVLLLRHYRPVLHRIFGGEARVSGGAVAFAVLFFGVASTSVFLLDKFCPVGIPQEVRASVESVGFGTYRRIYGKIWWHATYTIAGKRYSNVPVSPEIACSSQENSPVTLTIQRGLFGGGYILAASPACSSYAKESWVPENPN